MGAIRAEVSQIQPVSREAHTMLSAAEVGAVSTSTASRPTVTTPAQQMCSILSGSASCGLSHSKLHVAGIRTFIFTNQAGCERPGDFTKIDFRLERAVP